MKLRYILRVLIVILFVFLPLIFFTPIYVYEEPLHLLRLRDKLEKTVFLSNNRVAFMYFDIKTGEKLCFFPLLSQNPASVIKLGVIIEVFKQVEEDKLDFSKTYVLKKSDKRRGSGKLNKKQIGAKFSLYELLDYMITFSDNTATKILMDIIGLKNINSTFKSIGLKSTWLSTDNLLEAEGKNFTCANDMVFLMQQLFNGKVINPRISWEIIGIMIKQTYRWGIPKYLPAQVKVANKTGTLKNLANDVGIVLLDDSPYILAVFVSNAASYAKARQTIAGLSRIVFEWREEDKKL